MGRLYSVRGCKKRWVEAEDEHGAHRADIEAKKTTANDGDGSYAIDITNLIHLEISILYCLFVYETAR